MIAILGKRKRRDRLEDVRKEDLRNSDANHQVQALFQQHFEAKFRPLTGLPIPPQPTEKADSSTDNGGSDWEGLSDHDDVLKVQIVEHTISKTTEKDIPKDELRTFMTAKPPPIIDATLRPKTKPPSSTTVPSEDPQTESALLANDLALQRLLRESHLLTPSSHTKPLTLSGSARQKALDLRLQSLGAKTSLLKQQKMPMAHRKGIEAKAVGKEEIRRREARENGIILEREVRKERKGQRGKRERGVGAPGLGSFRGGMLRLSRRDVEEIEGPKGRGSGGRTGRGKRGRGRG